jgi:hypothetical protein
LLPLNQPPRTKLAHFSADLRGDAGRSNREATHHCIRHAPFALAITLLAENLQDSVNTDPLFHHWLTAFAALRAAGANARRVELEEFYTVNITSSPTSSAPIITIRFELAGPPSESKISASEVNICSRLSCCRLRLADRACSRCSALPLREASSDQWGPLVHASRPLLRPRLPYV